MKDICPSCKKKPKYQPKDGKKWSYCKECRCKKNKSAFKKKKNAKILCPRGEGAMIKKEECVPGCNDACMECKYNVGFIGRGK